MKMPSKTCLFIISLQLVSCIVAQQVMRRSPQGFLGMRGKKYTSIEDLEHLYKRKPQFFVGVKGKKGLIDYLGEPDVYNKRAPMGFVGMRGKKQLEDVYGYPEIYDEDKRSSLIGQIDYAPNDDLLREPASFPLLHRLLSNYLQQIKDNEDTESQSFSGGNTESNQTNEASNDQSNEVEKRAANMHQFYGVRGKKSIQNKRPFDLSFRGKFIGVRGKKDLKNNGLDEVKFLLGGNGPWPKRKAQMNGFFGMRGKKSVEGWWHWILRRLSKKCCPC